MKTSALAVIATACSVSLCTGSTVSAAEKPHVNLYAGLKVPDVSCDKGNGRRVCGMANPEDLEPVAGTDWVIVGALSPGKLFRVNRNSLATENLAPSIGIRWDKDKYGSCPGPLQKDAFFTHDIAVLNGDQPRLYTINHGDREAVEIFDIDRSNAHLAWRGCVSAPEGTDLNPVAPLPDDAFAVTDYGKPGAATDEAVVEGHDSGEIHQWSPQAGWKTVPHSSGSGPMRREGRDAALV